MYKNRSIALFIAVAFVVTTTFENHNVAHASPQQIVQRADKEYSFLERFFRFIQEEPRKALLVGGATLIAGYATFQVFKGRLRIEAAAPVAGLGAAGARGFGAPAPRGGAEQGAPNIRGGDMGRGGARLDPPGSHGVDHHLEAALLASAKEHAFREKLKMRPVDQTFNEDVFRQLQNIRDQGERILFIRALLYDLEQRFIDDENVVMFAISSQRLGIDAAIELFHQLTEHSWSLLQLAPELGELDPAGAVPMLGFREVLAEFRRLRDMLAAGRHIDDLRWEIEKRCRHPFDKALLEMLMSYLWELAGNAPVAANPITPQTHERVRLAMRHLLSEAFRPLPRIEDLLRAPLLPPAAVPADAAPSAPPELPQAEQLPPPAELPADELRRRRLELFEKKDKGDH